MAIQWVRSPLPKTLRWILSSDLETVGTGQSLLCEGLVHPGRIEDKGDILESGLLGRKVENLAHVKMVIESGLMGRSALVRLTGRLTSRILHPVEQHFSVLGKINESIVVVLDNSLGTVIRSCYRPVQTVGLDIEFLGGPGQRYLDAVLGRIRLGFLYILRRQVLQYLKTIIRVTALHGESHSDIEADHSGAGDTDAHGVLENIGAHLYADLRGAHGSVERAGLGHGQGHCNRLGTAEGGLHLPVQELKYV